MVETEFSIVRHRGDKHKADDEYKGLDPRYSDLPVSQAVADYLRSYGR